MITKNTEAKSREPETDSMKEQRVLGANAWQLARYAIEHAQTKELPFDAGRFMLWAEKYPNLDPEEKAKFIDQYRVLESCTTSKKTAKEEEDARQEQRILATNAWHLGRYVIEHEHELAPNLDFDAGQFLVWAEDYPALNPEEKILFVNQYRELENRTKYVTARTLVATRIHGRGFFKALRTSVGEYLVFLFLATFSFFTVLILSYIEYFDVNFAPIVTAFCAAGLGTCVYLLRVTQERLKTREFDPAFIPSHLIRLGLGTLAGGVIVIFPDLYLYKALGPTEPVAMNLQKATIAFVLGYAVDLFYSVLDNIGGKIKRSKT